MSEWVAHCDCGWAVEGIREYCRQRAYAHDDVCPGDVVIERSDGRVRVKTPHTKRNRWSDDEV